MDEIAVASPEKPQRHPSGNPNLAPLITPANAREMQLRSALARKKVRESTPQPLPVNEELTEYISRRLARVRLQLEMVDQRIEETVNRKVVNGQNLNWLCSAQERLSEQERTLAGRPLPGSLKPQAVRRSRQQQNLGPVEPEQGQ